MDLPSTTLTALGWPEVLDALAAKCATPAGQRAARALTLAADAREARAAYAAVTEVATLAGEGDAPPVGGVLDVAPAVDRAMRGAVLDDEDLRAVGMTLDALARLRSFLGERAERAPELARIAAAIEVDDALRARLRQSYAADGTLDGDYHPSLGELRRRIDGLRGRIRSTLDDILRGDSFGEALQDRYVTERNGRFVVPVKASYRRGLGIVHGRSGSGETVYLEPAAVVELHNDLREAEADLAEEERRIRAELSLAVAGRGDPTLRALEAACRLDLAVARWRLGTAWQGTVPAVGAAGLMVARAARHPLLALKGAVVANDLELSDRHPGLLLTGPNAGGKTVALKTLGLLALLVRAAVPIPAAEGARVDVFDPVLAEVGDQQSVAEGLSTFSAHLLALVATLERARPGALVLVDEIAVGTDPAQGAALARAVVEALVERGARVAVTTHHPELKALARSDPRFVVAAAEFADGKPTFRLVRGVPGTSHALEIARRMGLPEAILARARAVMDAAQRELAERLLRLEEEEQRARAETERLAAERAALAAREAKLVEGERRLRERQERELAELTERHRARLRAVEAEVREMVKALQANPDLKQANQVLRTLRAGRDVPVAPPPAAPPFAARPGDRVRVRALGQPGKVVAVGADGRLQVQVGRLTTWVELAGLEPLGGPSPKPTAPPRVDAEPGPEREPGGGDAVVRVDGNTCDLRGQRVDEALDTLEHFLDARAREGLKVVFVLHGHGTGALKTAVRAALPTSRYVRRARPADADEGGDAFTVVELR